MATVSERFRPTFEEKTSNALKADRVRHRATFNPNKASPGETLYVAVPKLEEGVVLVPGSFALVFDLVVSGEANNFLVNNVARALVSRQVVKFAGEILQDTNAFDIYKLYEDLFLPKAQRANMFLEGIQSEDLCKIRSNSGDKKTSGVDAEKKLNTVYGKKYRIRLGEHEILKNHGVFYPRALADELVFELKLSPASLVVKGSDANDLAYELTNIQLEYEALHALGLAKEVRSTYLNGKAFMYDHVTHHKTLTVKRGSDSIINESINIPRRSMKGLLLLFCETHAGGARDSEKFINPDITGVKVTVNGMPNKVYSQGIEGRDLWDEVHRHFGDVGANESNMNATDFYTGDKFGLFIDLRSMEDTKLHGSGLRLVNTKDGVQLEIERTASGSGAMKCHIFIISDAQFSIMNNELESVQY